MALIEAPTVVEQTVQTAKKLKDDGYSLERPVVSIIDTVVLAEDAVAESTILVTYGVSYVLDQSLEPGLESTTTKGERTQQVHTARIGRAAASLIKVRGRIKTLERATLHIKLVGNSWKLTGVE